MAKSTTVKESTEVFQIEKIRRFTQAEFARLGNTCQKLPFCYQLENSVLVGKFRVEKISDNCWRIYQDKNHLVDFLNRKDAIFYCIALSKKNYELADDIKRTDWLLNKLDIDASIYRSRYKSALKKSNTWLQDLYSSRYLETMDQLARAKKEMRKNLEMAKYLEL